jgi:alanine dehydrogenase
MKPVYVTFLNGPDIDALALEDHEILEAIESALAAQGRGIRSSAKAGPRA